MSVTFIRYFQHYLLSRRWIIAMYIKHFIFWLIVLLSIPTTTYTYIYIYICVCVCVCVFAEIVIICLTYGQHCSSSNGTKKPQIYLLFRVNLIHIVIFDVLWTFELWFYILLQNVTFKVWLLKHKSSYIFL